MTPGIIILGVFVVVGVIITLVVRNEKQRTEALENVATELSLSFNKKHDDRLLVAMQRFKLFNQGHGRKMKNVMQADTEIARLSIFDYQYTTGGGQHSQTHTQTVVAMESNDLALPNFRLRPEGFFDRVGSALGFQDIDFEGDKAFSDAYVLAGDNEEAIRSFLTPELRKTIVEHEKCCIESDRGVFIFYRVGRIKPEKLRDLMNEGFGIYTAFREACDA
ncbi:MAG: hypothetical protein AAFX06_18345 [Planctomycetota bacterium]